MQDFGLEILGKFIQIEKLKYNECGWDSTYCSFMSFYIEITMPSPLEYNTICNRQKGDRIWNIIIHKTSLDYSKTLVTFPYILKKS